MNTLGFSAIFYSLHHISKTPHKPKYGLETSEVKRHDSTLQQIPRQALILKTTRDCSSNFDRSVTEVTNPQKDSEKYQRDSEEFPS